MSEVAVAVVECPPIVRKYCDGFKDLLFTVGQYRSFVALVCGCVFGSASLCDIARYFLFAPCVSAMSQFLAAGISDKMSRRHRRRLRSLLCKLESDPGRYQYAIDDTLVERTGRKMWGVYRWFDHSSNSYVTAHKILVVGIVDKKRNVLIPLAWKILHRDLSEELENESRVCPHEKAWQVAISLLKDVLASGFPILPVAADSWFHGEGFCNELENLRFPYVIEAKSNRKVERHGQKRLHEKLAQFFKDRPRHIVMFRKRVKFASAATVTLQDSKRPVRVVAVANRRAIDDAPFAYYVSNQLTWDASRIWEHSRGRWTIEVQFRELKQLFALGEAAARSQESVETAVSISMIALTVIRLEQLADADSSQNQQSRQPVAAGAIVRDLMMHSVSRSLLKLAINPQPKTQQKFKSRYTRHNLNNKPAESRRKRERLDTTALERTAA